MAGSPRVMSGWARRLSLATLAATLLAMAGGLDGCASVDLDGVIYRCESSADCGPGWVCRQLGVDSRELVCVEEGTDTSWLSLGRDAADAEAELADTADDGVVAPTCDAGCEVANGTGACVDEVCVVAGCGGDYRDCDRSFATGCEEDVSESHAHCGACDAPCEANEACRGGSCECVPACEARACGADGCGGSCGEGCGEHERCNESAGVCECAPACEGRACGPDGCGGTCEPGCSEEVCHLASGTCYAPLPGYVFVHAGSFTMGSAPSEPPGPGDESQHPVTITRDYYMKATEVTVAEWTHVFGAAPPGQGSCGVSCPTIALTWYDALAYCNVLSMSEGLAACYDLTACSGVPGEGNFACTAVPLFSLDCEGYRLPTEAEWEYAARAGTSTSYFTGDITEDDCSPLDPALDPIAWYCGNSDLDLHPVAQKQANLWGLYDTAGNAQEWTWDWLTAYPSTAQSDPTGPAVSIYKAVRGGQYREGPAECRAGFRAPMLPNDRYAWIGLRPVRTVK